MLKQEQALLNWKEKLANYELELSINASTEQKFELRKKIEECEKEIERIQQDLKSIDQHIESPKSDHYSGSETHIHRNHPYTYQIKTSPIIKQYKKLTRLLSWKVIVLLSITVIFIGAVLSFSHNKSDHLSPTEEKNDKSLPEDDDSNKNDLINNNSSPLLSPK
ncbi:hypothetical protein [Moorena sp. SIO3I6]|uniref:hypothetical protein n=1 Tax=Moorena sp. SIO3I6 TaxID=2607831 RepID=UPI0013F867D5|nr:hypothetical protein [Moorena sp. SIO3I6]NEP27746.1 hypothetical protein [Moorena sp. SIO3I6]